MAKVLLATSENTNGGAALKTDVTIGQGLDYKVFTGDEDAVLHTDVALGAETPFQPGFIKDRAPNVPSGTTVNGVPTYGDGKRNTVTTFAADQSRDASTTTYTVGKQRNTLSGEYADLA